MYILPYNASVDSVISLFSSLLGGQWSSRDTMVIEKSFTILENSKIDEVVLLQEYESDLFCNAAERQV